MPYTHTIEGRVVHIAWAGVISQEDLQSIGRDLPRMAEELGFPPHVLHTFDGVTGRSFQPIAVYALSLLRKQRKIPVPVRSAIVAKTSEQEQLAAVFMALNRSPNLTMKSFDAEAPARAWLAEACQDTSAHASRS